MWSTVFQERISHTNILSLLSLFSLNLYLITVDIHSMKPTSSLQSSWCLKKRKVICLLFFNNGKFRGSFHYYLSNFFTLVWILVSLRFEQILSNSVGKSTKSLTGCCDDRYWFTNSFSRIARIWARGILNKDTNSRKKFLILL